MQTQMKSRVRYPAQRGGTIVGFVIGTVVGLLAALIVAVFVTKVPVPFVNKAVNRNAEQDQAEAAKNKNWDPNSTLTGKGVVAKPAEAPKASAPTAMSPVPAASVPAAAIDKTAEKPPTPAAEKGGLRPAPDPLGDLVKAKLGSASDAKPATTGAPGVLVPKPPTAVASASATADASGSGFFVQAGAYSNADEAEAQRGKIALGGLEAKITEREVSGRTVYRVRVGPIEKKPDADKVRERLEALGYDARVMTVSR